MPPLEAQRRPQTVSSARIRPGRWRGKCEASESRRQKAVDGELRAADAGADCY